MKSVDLVEKVVTGEACDALLTDKQGHGAFREEAHKVAGVELS